MYQTEKIILTEDMKRIISEIDALKLHWNTLALSAPHQLLALNHVAQLQNIIEKPDFFARAAQQPASELTEKQILKLHGELLKGEKDPNNSHGKYKTFHNSIRRFDDKGNEIEFVIRKAHPAETPGKLHTLISWYNLERQKKTLHPLIAIAVFHLVFLAIHPFDDGNGRICRFMTNLLLVQQGYIYMPFYGLENLIRKNNENWEAALLETEKTLQEDEILWEPWIQMFLDTLYLQKNGLQILMQQAQEAVSSLTPEEVSVLEYVRKHGKSSEEQMVKSLALNSVALQMSLVALCKKKLLRKTLWGLGGNYALAAK